MVDDTKPVYTPKTTEKGQHFIMQWEGCALRAYRDIVGVWTIGFGNTNVDKELMGFTISAGVTITFEDAMRIFRNSLVKIYEPEVDSALPNVALNVFDGGTSFHYNTGAIKRANWVKAFLRGDMAAVRAGLMSWNRAGGNVVSGLTSRRRGEANIVLNNDYGRLEAPAMIGSRGEILRSTAPMPGMLRNGSEGTEVADLQATLTLLGYYTGGDDATKFGDATEAALKSYQKDHPQLTPDGVAGPATRAALQRDADMKRKLAKVGGGGTVITTTGTVANQVTGGNIHSYVFIGIGVAFLIGVVILAWKYRDELGRLANKLSGGGGDGGPSS